MAYQAAQGLEMAPTVRRSGVLFCPVPGPSGEPTGKRTNVALRMRESGVKRDRNQKPMLYERQQ